MVGKEGAQGGKGGGRLNMLNWNLHSFQLLEIIQVLDSIFWVRCASGNVLSEIFNNEKLGKDSCGMPVVRRPLCAHPQTAWFPSKANLNFGKNIRISF